MKVGITGHDPVRLGDEESNVRDWIRQQLCNLRACYKDITLVTGLSIGVDQIAAIQAIKMGIEVKCLLPHKDIKISDTMNYIINNAEVEYLHETYIGTNIYQERNQKIVDECETLLVVWDGKNVGSVYYTYEYAKKQYKNIFLYPWKGGGRR